MRSRPFASADPFLKIILLFLLSFTCLGVFMLMAQGLITVVWGVDFFGAPESIRDYDKPYILHVNYVLLFFQHLGLFVVPALAFAALSAHEPYKALGMRPAKPIWLFGAVMVMVAAMPAVNALAWANSAVSFPDFLGGLERALQEMEDQAGALTEALASRTDLPHFLVNLVVLAVVPAIGEELIFRGLLLRIIASWTGSKTKGVWISAALFSAMHMQFYGFLPRLLLGALLGYLFVWSRTIWVPIAAHFANNAVALTLMYLIGTGVISAEVDSFEPEFTDLLLLLLSLAVFGGLVFWLRRLTLSGK